MLSKVVDFMREAFAAGADKTAQQADDQSFKGFAEEHRKGTLGDVPRFSDLVQAPANDTTQGPAARL